MAKEKTAQEVFEELSADSKPYIDRAKDFASYGLSFEFNDDPSGTAESEEEHQSIVARGIGNLSNKMMNTLFPVGLSFVRLVVPEAARAELKAAGQLEAAEEKLAGIERTISRFLESIHFRVSGNSACTQLIMTGNALVYITENGIKVYKLYDYVVRRDGFGNVLEIVTVDHVGYQALPEDIQRRVKEDEDGSEIYDVFTHIKLFKNKYKVYQEIEGEKIPGTEDEYDADALPWIPLRYSKTDGEHYGRGHTERYIADIRNLDALSKAIIDMSQLASRVIVLVNPDGVTMVRDLANAQNGDYIIGRPEDVRCLQLDKTMDLQLAYKTAYDIEQRLGRAFLLSDTVQQNKERQTATEVRLMVNALDETLGTVYSLQTLEFQVPLVKAVMNILIKNKSIPDIAELVSPTIISGLAALGRENDLQKMQIFLEFLKGIPETAAYLKNGAVLKSIGTNLGIDLEGILKTSEEVAQEKQQEQMMMMAQSAAPQVVSAMAQGIQNQGGQ